MEKEQPGIQQFSASYHAEDSTGSTEVETESESTCIFIKLVFTRRGESWEFTSFSFVSPIISRVDRQISCVHLQKSRSGVRVVAGAMAVPTVWSPAQGGGSRIGGRGYDGSSWPGRPAERGWSLTEPSTSTTESLMAKNSAPTRSARQSTTW